MPDWLVPVASIIATGALGFLTWTATKRTSDRDWIIRLRAELETADRKSAAAEKATRREQDYSLTLRSTLEAHGIDVPPYPEEK